MGDDKYLKNYTLALIKINNKDLQHWTQYIRNIKNEGGQMAQSMPERRNPRDNKQEPVTAGEGI